MHEAEGPVHATPLMDVVERIAERSGQVQGNPDWNRSLIVRGEELA